MSETPEAVNKQAQYWLIDLLKVLAAQVIILHHCVSYGQLATQVGGLMPELTVFLFDYGRYAVQVFLVMAGYLAAQSLSKAFTVRPNKSTGRQLVQLALRRYLRLIGPFIVALMLTIIAAVLARHWLSDEYVGQTETAVQFLAHVFLLHGLLGFDSISAGAWYVAIDWQLYTSLAIALALFPDRGRQILILTLLMLVSLFYFNRDAAFENYFIYFIGSYGLGVLAFFSSDHRIKKVLLLVGLLIAVSALHSVWLRNYIALATAIVLMYAGQLHYAERTQGDHIRTMAARVMQWAGPRAYCAFLIHFTFILLANTAFVAFGLQSAAMALGLIGLVWLMSWIAASYLYRWVELPFGRLRPQLLFD